MRYVVAMLVLLSVSSASAQDIFFEDSYSTPDYGYGYSTTTYGWSGGLGSPLRPYYVDSYASPDYGYGRHTSSYGFGSSYDYSPRYGCGYGYSSGYTNRYSSPRFLRRW